MSNRIAFIPARGGSKRIPFKNIKTFAGQPMLAWPIQTAHKSDVFDQIIVSTDSKEIADIAMACGADSVLMRPPSLADDHTALRPVIRQAISALEADGPNITEMCCIYATAAFLLPEDLQDGYRALQDESVDYSVAAVAYPHPVQRAFYISASGGVAMAYPHKRTVRTQDLKLHFHDAGMFFWGRRDAFFTDISIYTEQSRLIEIPRDRAIDIDEPEDWQIAEIAFEVLKRNQIL